MVAKLLTLTKNKNIHCIVVQIFKFRKHFLLKVSTAGISFTLGWTLWKQNGSPLNWNGQTALFKNLRHAESGDKVRRLERPKRISLNKLIFTRWVTSQEVRPSVFSVKRHRGPVQIQSPITQMLHCTTCRKVGRRTFRIRFDVGGRGAMWNFNRQRALLTGQRRLC